MMKLIQAQKAAKTNIFPDYWTLLYGRRLSDIMIKTLTGTLPLTFRTSETALRSWTIYGNDFQHEESRGTRLPLSFYSDEDKLRDWTIYGNNTPHNYSAEGTLPLTFTTHTAGAASDWEIAGNDNLGYNILPSAAPETKTDGNFSVTCDGKGKYTLNKLGSIDVDTVIYFDISPMTIPQSIGNGGNGCISLFNDQTINGVTIRFYKNNTQIDFISLATSADRQFTTYSVPENQEINRLAFRISSISSADIESWSLSPMITNDGTTPTTFDPYQIGVGQRTKNLISLAGSTQTTSGTVEFTIDGTNGIITANGTCGSTTSRVFCDYTPSETQYVLFSGCPEGGSGTKYDIYCWDVTTGARCTRWDGTTQSDADYGETEREAILLAGHQIQLVVRIMTNFTADNLVFRPMFRLQGSTAGFIPFGYEIPLTISQTGQTDKNYDIYIGSAPLTEGETVSKASTGVDLELFEGENTVSTTLYNKPETSITYTDYLGVGEYVNGQWQIPLTVTHYTDNIFDKDAKNTNKGYEDGVCIMWAGSIPNPYLTGNEDNNYFVSEKIPCSPNTTYYLSDGIFKNTDNGIYSVFLWNRFRMSDYQAFPTEKTFTTGDDTQYIQICVLKAYADTVMITTQPTETYIPHVEVNNVNVPIDAPLTASDTATKASTGVDIATYVGTNAISTTLENKPEMLVYYGYKGAGEHSGDTWELYFITQANGNQQLTKITMDKPLRAGETLTSEQAGVTIPTYADAENTLSLYPSAAGYGNPEMTITYKGG